MRWLRNQSEAGTTTLDLQQDLQQVMLSDQLTLFVQKSEA